MSPERLGQHFLVGAGWREKILAAIRPAAESVWLEIGAGHGEMTAFLAKRVRRVVAIELDAALAKQLREVTAPLGNIEVVSRDVLSLDLGAVAGANRFHVYGSLPYYITSPILHRLFDIAGHVEGIHVVIQMEVAERLVARPGSRNYGYLSVLTQFHSRPSIRLRIPPGAFRPRPKVSSAVVSMTLPGESAGLGIENEKAFFGFVKECFAQKRKTLRNNLRASFDDSRAKEIIQKARIEPRARAEELSLTQFAALFRAAR